MTNLNLKKYRLKIPVEAIQVSPENIDEIIKWLNSFSAEKFCLVESSPSSKEIWATNIYSNFYPADIGDWITVLDDQIESISHEMFSKYYKEN